MKVNRSPRPEDHPEMFGINLFELPAIYDREKQEEEKKKEQEEKK